MVETYYTPSLPATILSPARLGKQKGCNKYSVIASLDGSTSTLKLHHPSETAGDILIDLCNNGGLLYSRPLILPHTDEEKYGVCALTGDTDVSEQHHVAQLTQDQLRILWHQRLGHIHSRRMSEMHKYVEGVPKLPVATELDTCPICVKAKLHKADQSKSDSRHATRCNQGISIDFGFMVQASSNESRKERLSGLNGETSYCLITDHFSGTLYGATFRSKAPPLAYLNQWLATHGLPHDVPDKYARMDLGGELGRSPEVKELLKEAGYHVETTAANSSHQNGPGERPHRTLGDGIRAMLGGANLEAKFWPYAFHHFIRLYNVSIHGNKDKSPFEICTGRKPDLKQLKTFGCRIYSLANNPNKNFKDKAVSDVKTGIFLGYSRTMKTALVYNVQTGKVVESQHVAFDEGFNGEDNVPPNAKLLKASGMDPEELESSMDFRGDVESLEVDPSPFTRLEEVTMPCNWGEETALGLEFSKCSRMLRAFISHIDKGIAAKGLKNRAFHRKYLGAYVVEVQGEPVYSVDDIVNVLDNLALEKPPPATVILTLALEKLQTQEPKESHLHGQINMLCTVSALNLVDGEGRSPIEVRKELKTKMKEFTPTRCVQAVQLVHEQGEDEGLAFSGAAPEVMDHLVYRVNQMHNDHMTDEEKQLKHFTRRNLMRLANWKTDWEPAFDAQLDGHFESGALGHPIKRPAPTEDAPANVLRLQWANVVKDTGKRKARACLDGSKRSAPWLRELASTYASCIEAPCMRLFFAMCAAKNFIVVTADTTNAFQQSPPPSVPCFVEIDDAYEAWYARRFPDAPPLDRRAQVIPLGRALQGHPEAGRLWETMIVGILTGELKFVSTTHERNLYAGEIDGQPVLVSRQVDDFGIGTTSIAIAEKLVALINERVTTTSEGMGKMTDLGMHLKYNGLDVHQTAHYIKIHCESYIDKMLQTHGWDSPSAQKDKEMHSIPMSPEMAARLMKMEPGPPEGSQGHKELETKAGTPYRNLLGELVYAYTLCRVDISNAVTLLSRFSTAPNEAHYQALRAIAIHLRATKKWGIIYWRPCPNNQFPVVPLDQPAILTEDLSMKYPVFGLEELIAFCDAAHATDLRTRRSVTGFALLFAGGVVAYKCKLQAIVATSSTEAEFIAAVLVAKMIKYLRSVLMELGYLLKEPTRLFIDNKAAIAMINESKPTPRSRHIDTQYFAIQEWRARDILRVAHIAGVMNPADALTKPLGPTLFLRHILRLLGHFGKPS